VHRILSNKAVEGIDRRQSKTEELKMKSDSKSKSDNREHNYIESDEERNRGHVDTRYKNFECENKTNLGCDPGVDVAG
jgi:hypothetical protein